MLTRSVKAPKKGATLQQILKKVPWEVMEARIKKDWITQTGQTNRKMSGKPKVQFRATSRHIRQLMADASVVNSILTKKDNSTTKWQTVKNLMTIVSPSLFMIWALCLLGLGYLSLTALILKVLSPLLPIQAVSWIVATESQIYHWLLPTP